MRMIIDVILTVAEITAAAGAIPEFQLRICHICPSADGAAVGIGGFGRGMLCLIRAGKGDGAGLLGLRGLLLEQPAGVDPPGQRDHVHHILTYKQDVVY